MVLQQGWLGSAGDGLRLLLAVVAVCALALLALRLLARRGLFVVSGPRGRVQLLQRVGLDTQRSLYLVRADERILLIGAGPNAAPVLITELAPQAASEATASGAVELAAPAPGGPRG